MYNSSKEIIPFHVSCHSKKMVWCFEKSQKVLVQRGYSPLQSLIVFLCQSSDQDLIFLGQASIGIEYDLQNKKRDKKNTWKNPKLIKIHRKIIDMFLHTNFKFFFCKMLLILYNNKYYDYWDLITKFWLCSIVLEYPLQ